MNNPTRNLLKVAGVLAGLGAAAWALRDRMLPQPEISAETAPKFRTGSSSDDLTLINGIGPVYRDRLVAAGIETFAALGASESEEIAETAGTSSSVAAGWVKSAQSMA